MLWQLFLGINECKQGMRDMCVRVYLCVHACTVIIPATLPTPNATLVYLTVPSVRLPGLSSLFHTIENTQQIPPFERSLSTQDGKPPTS